MHILMLTTHLNTGGITSYLWTLSRELVREGHRVSVLSSGGDRKEEFVDGGIDVWEFPVKTKSELNPRIYLSLQPAVRMMRAHGVHILHAHSRVTQVMAVLLSAMTGRPYLSTCHGFFKVRLSRKLFPCWGQKVIAISPAVHDHLVHDFGVDEQKVAVIPNGIDMEQFFPTDAAQKNELRRRENIAGAPVIGIVARLSDVKGHHVLLSAMPKVRAAFPDVRLLIVGEGKCEEALKAQTRQLELVNTVLFFPIVNQPQKFLSMFDVFVMPSLQEGLGLSVMEAQASGLPVVASRVGGIPSLIREDETGILVDSNDPDRLADALIDLLRNPSKAAAIGRAARAFVERKFSSKQMAEQTLNIYSDLLKTKSSE